MFSQGAIAGCALAVPDFPLCVYACGLRREDSQEQDPASSIFP